MTITQELQTLLNTKGEIRQAIIDKGVAVAENAPFDSYADKISQISGGSGASSVAEYVYKEDGNLTNFPRQPLKAEDNFVYTYHPSIWHSDYDDNASTKYLEDTNEFAIYYYFEDVANLFDGSDDTTCSIGESYRALYFKFAKETKVSQIKLRVKNDSYYTATANVHASNLKEKATTCEESNKVVLYTIPAMIKTPTDVVIDVNQTYKYWGVLCGPKVYACEIIADSRVYTMTLKSANMSPTIRAYPEDYMQIITQDWYNGSEIVPGQTIIAKPYKDGGCLVNYTDDGKAVNLKMFYMKSNGEKVGKIYNNFTVFGTLNIDENTGIAKGFTNINTIELPIALSSDNWQFSIKANYQRVDRHQGLFYDKNLSRNFGEIHSTTQTMSSYITGSWTDGTVALDNVADYWFLFDFSNGVLTSYVKKDNNYISCPSKENMNINFTIQGLNSFSGHKVGLGNADSGEQWESTIDLSTAVLIENGVEVWNAATKVALKDTYVLAPDNTFTLEGYSEKTQVADLKIPAHSVPGVGTK